MLSRALLLVISGPTSSYPGPYFLRSGNRFFVIWAPSSWYQGVDFLVSGAPALCHPGRVSRPGPRVTPDFFLFWPGLLVVRGLASRYPGARSVVIQDRASWYPGHDFFVIMVTTCCYPGQYFLLAGARTLVIRGLTSCYPRPCASSSGAVLLGIRGRASGFPVPYFLRINELRHWIARGAVLLGIRGRSSCSHSLGVPELALE